MGYVVADLPAFTNRRLSGNLWHRTVFVTAFSYCQYSSMCTGKSQMFFTGNIKFGMVTKIRGPGNGKLEKVPVDK
jgi:hypothetical protein